MFKRGRSWKKILIITAISTAILSGCSKTPEPDNEAASMTANEAYDETINAGNTFADNFTSGLSEDEKQQLENALDIINALSGNSDTDNWIAPDDLWLDIFASPQFDATMDFDSLLASARNTIPIELADGSEDFYIKTTAFGYYTEGPDGNPGNIFYQNLLVDIMDEGLYKMSISMDLHAFDAEDGWSEYTRKYNRTAAIWFDRRKGSMEDGEQKAFYEFLCAQAAKKYAPLPARDGDGAVFGASSGGKGMFIIAIDMGYSTVSVTITTNNHFTYAPPDNKYTSIAYDPAALARIVPNVLAEPTSGGRMSRYLKSAYNALTPNGEGRVSSPMVLAHEHGADAEIADSVRDANNNYIDGAYARMDDWAAGFNCWSVGMTPFTIDFLSPLKHRQPLNNLTAVVDYAFTTLGHLTTLTEDLREFQVTGDMSRSTTLVSAEWHGLFSDKTAAFDVYRQLALGFVNFYADEGFNFYAGGLDLTPLYLSAYYSDALNEETGIIGYDLWITNNAKTANTKHPALNISGIGLELTRLNNGGCMITARFQRNESYAGVIIPAGSSVIP
jgi:hypothetical protein